MQHYVVQHNRSIAALEVRHQACCCCQFLQSYTTYKRQQLRPFPLLQHAVARPDLSLPLLQLPDNVLELIAIKLPPTTMVHFSNCCSCLQRVLHGDRLWQRQLEAFQPFWVSAGVTPKAGRLQGQSWHELVATAYKLQTLKCSTTDDEACLPATPAWQELWKAGVYTFHLVLGLSNSCSCSEQSASGVDECTTECHFLQATWFTWTFTSVSLSTDHTFWQPGQEHPLS